ncbi:hypothetical protein [Skermanella stibiiresistens]|uniref:hypothetical protein n=1 Tax=Skermanella stibiiresistens TaxID=913326 RepID=UPI0004B158EE|nr:hypothetical protein [Skermanella stibiiresistens]
MAKIVMGIGSSHSPTLLMEPNAWVARAEHDDRHIHALHHFDGKMVTYDEMLAKTSPGVLDEIKPEVLEERHKANQRGVETLSLILREVDPDVVMLIGDDEVEVQRDPEPGTLVPAGIARSSGGVKIRQALHRRPDQFGLRRRSLGISHV